MKIIVGKNDTGKTKELIKYSLDSGIPIFALYESKADSLRAKALSYFNKPVSIVTPQDFIADNYHGDILVDDMEKVFTTLLAAYVKSSDFNIVAATVTDD